MESVNATTNNGNEEILLHPDIAPDESDQIGSTKNLISLSSNTSSTSSVLSLEDLRIVDDEKHNENLSESGKTAIEVMERPETIQSHVVAKKMFTGPGNWSMASNESLFSLRMDSTNFCHLDSFSPLFDLPYDKQCVDGKILETDEGNYQGSSVLDEPAYIEDEGSRFSASTSSSSNSLVFPILLGETENDGSPYPHGSLIEPVPQSPPKPEPALDRRSKPKASGTEAEAKETTTYAPWSEWFPCFRYCACCS
ncbi:hypothetical protein M8C21_016257 [Ambrosia artemisiifolia]|uniref:Uncharacterized protein n=1 Tax=Ambrosia artemisiifolia TaxID=4212 RepID=A0AAD5CSS1_AMBAR|nr:hypothetical protein M8C21_016257 [Ambrosia artemisiifolia]